MSDETPREDLRAGHDSRVPTRDMRARSPIFSSYLAHVFGVANDDLRALAARDLDPGARFVLMAVLIARRIRYLNYCANMVRAELPPAPRSGAYGLWQVTVPRMAVAPPDQAAQALAYLQRYREPS